MSESANVRAVNSLDELRGALVQFRAGAQESLQAAAQEIARTFDWLAERKQHWQNETRRREEKVREARNVLARCEASGYRDEDGHYHQPDCSSQQNALLQAQVYLREAEAELHTVQGWINLVQQAADTHQQKARQFNECLTSDVTKATALLGSSADRLRTYAATASGISSASMSAASDSTDASPIANASFSTDPPTQIAGDVLSASVKMGATDSKATSATLGVLHWLAKNPNYFVGTEIGERLAAELIEREMGWQQLPFDPAKQGFDRAFTAPEMPLIIMESKVDRKGEFHPRETKTMGSQGSAEWIAAHAQRMADPSSKEWSPANEQIAALIHKMGPENVPVVSVVIHRDTGQATIYYRDGSVNDWQTLKDRISLYDVLMSHRS